MQGNSGQATPPGCWLAGGGGMNIHEYSLSAALLCPARLPAVFQSCVRLAAATLFRPTLPPFNKRRLLRQIYISIAMEQWLPEYNQNIGYWVANIGIFWCWAGLRISSRYAPDRESPYSELGAVENRVEWYCLHKIMQKSRMKSW